MPIVHFEYTDNLQIHQQVKPFLLEVHSALVDLIKTDLLTCRSQIKCCDEYVIADGSKEHAFIHLNIMMLPGRSKAVKDHLAEKLLSMIDSLFKEAISQLSVQVRVQLTETDVEYYYGL